MTSSSRAESVCESTSCELPETPFFQRRVEQYLTRGLRSKYSAAVYPVLCCAALLICIALAHPFANSAFNDDWSYSDVALKLAETGRLHYNGWGSPMILVQAVWGAAWIRLFGFSFNVLRAATIPFSVGFVLLVYALGRRAGLRGELALFGALTVGTSPLFVPLAASFMTEAYSCFFIAVCLYAAIASAETTRGAVAERWLWLLALSGIVGGSNRQVVWAAPLALIPYLFWKRRTDRRFATHAVVAYSLCATSVAVLMAKLSQPYAPLELSARQLMQLLLDRWFIASAILENSALSCLLLALPALLWIVTLWKQLGALRWIVSGVVCATSTALLVVMFGLQHGLAPFLGNILSPFGILRPGQDALGSRPVVLPLLLRIVLTLVLLLAVAAFGHLYKMQRDLLPRIPATVFSIFGCSYIALLVPGALVGFSFDRYVLPLLPVLVIFILVSFRCRVQRVPFAAWCCLVVFASYSVTTTHDYFSGLRARVLAAQILEKGHIPLSEISVGVENDGWTELRFAASIRPVLYGDHGGNTTDTLWFWAKAKAVKPDYVVSYWPVSQLPAKRIVTVPFRTWLPPFRWTVVALKRADLIKTVEPKS